MTHAAPLEIDAPATVLVVEDEGLIRIATADYLRDCGWNVLEAASGEEAQALFTAGGQIDAVFSDVQMSANLDGVALARWLRAHHPGVPVVLTSGVAVLSDIPAEICAQASTFQKPYQCDAVSARLSILTGARER